MQSRSSSIYSKFSELLGPPCVPGQGQGDADEPVRVFISSCELTTTVCLLCEHHLSLLVAFLPFVVDIYFVLFRRLFPVIYVIIRRLLLRSSYLTISINCLCAAQHRGFAYISYRYKKDADEALEKLNGYGYDHLILKVERAKPSNRDPGTSSGLSGGFTSGYGKALPQGPFRDIFL